MDRELEEKLDRNWDIYNKLLNAIQSVHTKPSPETIKAIKELNQQMEKITLILEQLVNMLKAR